jgi:hypothetical protein
VKPRGTLLPFSGRTEGRVGNPGKLLSAIARTRTGRSPSLHIAHNRVYYRVPNALLVSVNPISKDVRSNQGRSFKGEDTGVQQMLPVRW